MAFGSLQSCSNMSSGHASCPGLPACSTEAAVPSLSCPVLPAQPGTVGRYPYPHPVLLSALLLVPSFPVPGSCQPFCQPHQREQCPLYAHTQPSEFFDSVYNPRSQTLPPFQLIIFKCFISPVYPPSPADRSGKAPQIRNWSSSMVA